MNQLFKLFTQLAQIDSPSGKEAQVCEFIVKFLQDLNLNPETDSNGIIYCRIGNQPNPILFCAHMDTVEPGRGVKVVEDQEWIKSDNTTILGGDNKVSLATILYSLRKLIEDNKELNIELLFTVREETDSGIQQFNVSKLESKVGFIFDGGLGEIGWLAQSAPTIEDFEIQIRGKSAHASAPQNGVNALQVLLNTSNNLKLGKPDEYSTLNIGLISGGFSTNTVPEILELKGDLRSTNSESFKRIKREFEETINNSAKKLNATVEFKWIPYSIGYNMNLESQNFIQLKKIYSEQKVEINPKAVTSGSDAAFLNSVGIETYCLGDAVYDTHKLSERIKKSDFKKLAELVESLMIKYKY